MAKAKAGKVSIKGASPADKQQIALARKANAEDRKVGADADKPAAAKRQVTGRGDEAPEAKATPKAKSAAAEKMFKNADDAARAGLPADITVEQNDNRLRRTALGY